MQTLEEKVTHYIMNAIDIAVAEEYPVLEDNLVSSGVATKNQLKELVKQDKIKMVLARAGNVMYKAYYTDRCLPKTYLEEVSSS